MKERELTLRFRFGGVEHIVCDVGDVGIVGNLQIFDGGVVGGVSFGDVRLGCLVGDPDDIEFFGAVKCPIYIWQSTLVLMLK